MSGAYIIITLRFSFAFLLLGVTGWFGYKHSALWTIPILGVGFTILYIAGKWYIWKDLWLIGRMGAWAKNVAITLPIQTLLAALVYFIGLGIGRVFSDQTMNQSVSSSDLMIIAILTVAGVIVSMVINRLAGGRGSASAMEHYLKSPARANASEDNEKDFEVLDEPVTKENVFSSYRESFDYTNTAIVDITEYDGNKPKRIAYAANDVAIAEAEARLGFALPEGLKQLYKVKNGGNVCDLMIAIKEDPRPVYDDWVSPFSGYKEMYSLQELRTVHDSILDFACEDEEDCFPEGAKQLLILAQWYQETLFLDYRAEGEPRVGFVDFDDVESWEDKVLWLGTFDEFFARLVRVDPYFDTPDIKPGIASHHIDISNPDRFWSADNITTDGATEQTVSSAEKRLVITIPDVFRPLWQALDGGKPYFNILPDITSAKHPDGLQPFADHSVLPIGQWITLRELSDRLDFIHGHTPWADLWEESDRLIVVSASFDTALMIDYRGNANEPTMLYIDNLDQPDTAISLGTPEKFIENLRAQIDYYNPPIADTGRNEQDLI